jgi:hypothetical protein
MTATWIAIRRFLSLAPISLLLRSARVRGGRTTVVHGMHRFTYAEMLERCRQLERAREILNVGVERRGNGRGVCYFLPSQTAAQSAG